MIADSGFLISVRAGAEAAVDRAVELEAASVPIRVPTIVLTELYYSVGAGDDPILNQEEYEALLANKPIVSLDENIARRAGVLNGVHDASDSLPTLGIPDAIVAATGLVFNEAVITIDRDLQSVEGLDVELV